ncbi:MAG: hypothetical protein Q9225_005679 [Loekoesia sp. 1 TL-2023]
MLQYVRTLAEVPKNPLNSDTPIRTSEVSSFTGLSKRKRSEIALAVDNHSIGIYDVNNSAARQGQRSTYCSVSDPQPKLVCFSEENPKNISLGGQLRTLTFNLPTNSSPIVHIEALATYRGQNDPTHADVLVFHEDGEICCYNEALTSKTWNTRIAPGRHGDHKTAKLQIKHASTVSIQQATKTILKDREDLVKVLDAKQNVYASNLLLVLSRSIENSLPNGQGALTFRILAIKNGQQTDSDALSRNSGLIEELSSFVIPEPLEVQGKETLFSLHTSSELLYQGTAGELSIYDLTALAPRLVQTMSFLNAKDALSYIRISPNLVATSSADSVSLIDTKFASVQARYKLPMPKQARSRVSNDRKMMSPSGGTAGAQLLSYHSPSNSVILLLGRNLTAVDLSPVLTQKSIPRKRKRNGLLIDAIGRGSLCIERSQLSRKRVADLPRVLGQILDPYQETAGWKQQKKTLDILLEKGGLLEFDRMMTSALEDEKPLPDHGAVAEHPPQYKVDYLLSMMFSAVPSKRSHEDGRFLSELHLRHLPEKAWQYVIQKGLISTEQLEASLKRQNLMHQNNAIRDDDLIKTLADFDPTLATLLSLLQSPCLLKISEVCHALKITTLKFETLATPDSMQLLTQGNELVDPEPSPTGNMELENGNPGRGSPADSNSRSRFHALVDKIVRRCNTCPTLLLNKALKRQLSRSELRSVVDMLRIELAQNGWLSPYTEDRTLGAQGKQYDDNQISMIAKLLNSVVDSLGTGGWLLNNRVTDGFAEAIETVSYMRAEVYAALEGIEESAYLQGMLGEILLCGKHALNTQANRPPLILELGDRQKCALPLGLKLDHTISLTKVGAGGELQKRSRRDIGKLKSRRVPEYSFERIAV